MASLGQRNLCDQGQQVFAVRLDGSDRPRTLQIQPFTKTSYDKLKARECARARRRSKVVRIQSVCERCDMSGDQRTRQDTDPDLPFGDARQSSLVHRDQDRAATRPDNLMCSPFARSCHQVPSEQGEPRDATLQQADAIDFYGHSPVLGNGERANTQSAIIPGQSEAQMPPNLSSTDLLQAMYADPCAVLPSVGLFRASSFTSGARHPPGVASDQDSRQSGDVADDEPLRRGSVLPDSSAHERCRVKNSLARVLARDTVDTTPDPPIHQEASVSPAYRRQYDRSRREIVRARGSRVSKKRWAGLDGQASTLLPRDQSCRGHGGALHHTQAGRLPVHLETLSATDGVHRRTRNGRAIRHPFRNRPNEGYLYIPVIWSAGRLMAGVLATEPLNHLLD